MSTNTEPPPQPPPPDKLDPNLRGGKAIFFTLDTLFNRDFATERGLIRCKQLIPNLRGKSMDELKRAYHDGMAAAYVSHIHSQLSALGCHPTQGPVDKVEMMFRELNLEPPSRSDTYLIGREFGAEFNRNRFEVAGASETLAQLKSLDYAIVVADDDLEWDAVKDLNFWQYVDANIITKDPVLRKPDLRVFKRALDACGVSPKNAVIVGCSVEKDIAGILNAEAEPILYMPKQNSMEMKVQGTRVLVVRSMAELLSEISRRPENRHLEAAQRHQVPPPPSLSHPRMPQASQNQGYANDQNGGPSSQHRYEGSGQSQRPAPDPNSTDDRHTSQSWGKAPLSRILSHSGSSNETPRRHRLPDRGHPPKCYEKTARPVPTLRCTPAKRPRSEHGYVPPSRYHDQGYPDHEPPRGHHDPAGRPVQGPSAQTSSTDTPQLARLLMRPNGDGTEESSTGSRSPAYTPLSPPPTPLPSMRMFPPTEDYGIIRATSGENQPRSQYDGHGRGTLRNGNPTPGGYPTVPPPRSPYRPPIPDNSTYREPSWVGRNGNEYETSGDRYSTRGGYPPETPFSHQGSRPRDARHQGQYQSWHSGQYGEALGRSYPTQDPHRAAAAIAHPAPHGMSLQLEPPSSMYGEHGRHTSTGRNTSMYEATPDRPCEIHNARPSSGYWGFSVQRGQPSREEQRVQPHHGEVINVTSPATNPVPSSQAPQPAAQDPAILGDPSHHGDSNSTPPGLWSTLTDTGSSPATLTPQTSSPESARPDDADAEPPCRRQRTGEELREIAEAVIDLSRGHPIPPL
ncbi:hypothetical protein FVEG_11736 [Fusarium verticillioides 7600]|uniref:Uncharacterized protein n=1 Tax=Gibberella moniliformis (strain M3125 / FGSC 7600) TaxID=334819 RepID=W7MQ87_GIBM7|nr:hypothetical protein FVEG_11736 [Fusarium verticillioides 7600]EWG53271.1 hypothetical protein FVEG_11736 [Fusarium verticillioides 7600]